jgi:hypothetical protein
MPQAVYKDTPNNRKLNRVGKPFGDPKFKVSKATTPIPKKASDYEGLLKSRIDKAGGKVSFKVFSDVLDWVDTFGNMKNKIFDNIIKFADHSKFKTSDAEKGFKEHNKGFYEEEIKGNVWTFNTLKSIIKKKYSSQSYPTG